MSGAVALGVGITSVPIGLVWRLLARTRAEAIRAGSALTTPGTAQAEIEQSERRAKIATGMAIGGAVLVVVGLPLLITGAILKGREGDDRQARRTRRVQPLVGLDRDGASVGVRMRF